MTTTQDQVRPRVPSFEGSQNFRDMGGYVARDGRRTRWGRIYRSGNMSGLTDADRAKFSTFGVKVVCDLRTNTERKHEPYDWLSGFGVEHWARDHERSGGNLATMIKNSTVTVEKMRGVMFDIYREFPYEQRDAYAALMRRIAAGDVPLVFNCSAGKDRTGVAAAILLTLLDVPREVIIEDYALTNKTLNHARLAFLKTGSSSSSLSPEVRAPLLAADPIYLSAMFEALETKHGSIQSYAETELNVDKKTLTAIRDQLLE